MAARDDHEHIYATQKPIEAAGEFYVDSGVWSLAHALPGLEKAVAAQDEMRQRYWLEVIRRIVDMHEDYLDTA